MAHRVAELIERAEQAKSDADRELAQRECADLIIRLWEHRAERSRARPLAEIKEFLEEFTRERPPYRRTPPEGSEHTWLSVLPYIAELAEREYRICRDAAISKVSIEEERVWLEDHNDDLSENERQVIEIIVELYDDVQSEHYDLDGVHTPNFARLSPEERTKRAIEALEQISHERDELLESLKLSEGYQDVKVTNNDDGVNTDSIEKRERP